MIRGVGVDIVEVRRIEQALHRHQERFLERLLTDAEQQRWQATGSRIDSLAGIWAAKEAVAKALGTGFRGFNLRDIVILPNASGKPTVTLFGGASAAAHAQSAEGILVTISHSENNAIAFAVAE